MAYDGGYSIDPISPYDLPSVLPPLDYTLPDLGQGGGLDLTPYLPDLSGVDVTGGGTDWSKILSSLGGGGGLSAAALGALLGSMDGSKQTGTQTVTSAPWSGQQPYLLDLFKRAQTQSQQPGNSPQMDAIFNKMLGNAGIQSGTPYMQTATPQGGQFPMPRNQIGGAIEGAGWTGYPDGVTPQGAQYGQQTPEQQAFLNTLPSSWLNNSGGSASVNPANDPTRAGYDPQAGGWANPPPGSLTGPGLGAMPSQPAYSQSPNMPNLNSTGMGFNQNGVLIGPQEMQRISESAQAYNQSTGKSLSPMQYDKMINPQTYMDRWGPQTPQTNPTDLLGSSQSVIQNNLNSDPTKAFGIGRTNPYMGQNTTVGTNPYAGVDNPYLNASINNASQDAMRNLNPAFIQSQIGSGSFGNSGLGETFARSAASTLGNIATNARMQDYTQQQGLAENAINRNLQNAQFNQSLNSSLAQQGIQNDLNQYNTSQSNQLNSAFNVPSYQGVNQNNLTNLYGVANTQNQNQWKPLQNYGSLVTGNYGSTNSSPIYSNPAASALGGGLLGSQIYSNIFGGK